MAKASVNALITILRNAQALGIDGEELKRRASLADDALADANARIDSEYGFRLMSEAEAVSNDPLFGLHHGSQFQASDMGLVGYLVLNAPTVGEALDSFCKFQDIYGEGLRLEVHRMTGFIEIRFCVHPDMQHIAADCAYLSHMAGFIATVRWLLGNQLEPTMARLGIARPQTLSHEDEYRSVFGNNIAFGEKSYSLTFSGKDISQNILTSNSELYAMVESRAQLVLQDIGNQDTCRHIIARELHRSLDKGKPSLDSVAKRLHKSPRTVQRQLKEEGTSFQRILDQVREKLAKYYLETRNLNIDEITFLLGFSESSAFRKAFRKWTEMSPESFRSSLK